MPVALIILRTPGHEVEENVDKNEGEVEKPSATEAVDAPAATAAPDLTSKTPSTAPPQATEAKEEVAKAIDETPAAGTKETVEETADKAQTELGQTGSAEPNGVCKHNTRHACIRQTLTILSSRLARYYRQGDPFACHRRPRDQGDKDRNIAARTAQGDCGRGRVHRNPREASLRNRHFHQGGRPQAPQDAQGGGRCGR